jgi:hypothetical protein
MEEALQQNVGKVLTDPHQQHQFSGGHATRCVVLGFEAN